MKRHTPQAPFSKYHALGNDYLILDPARQRGELAQGLKPAQVRAICDRQRGVGSDGIVYGPLMGEEHPGHFACVIWNPDGSQAEVSGNGLRIFARYLADEGYVSLPDERACILHSGGRTIPIAYGPHADSPIRVELGRASTAPGPDTLPAHLLAALGPPTQVNVGNPHCVFFPHLSIDESLARDWGPRVETDPSFPKRTNVQFVRIVDRHTIAIEIWERGAGYTQASGSSSCAAALAAISRRGCASPVTVQMAGGALLVDAAQISGQWHVSLTGPVTPVFDGYWRAGTGRSISDS
ncbi:MAG: diaminopimelate epimerase [Caldilineaceae bacterium]|nr:diaminopimelate epimerase [Caldilineaceae bacterium]